MGVIGVIRDLSGKRGMPCIHVGIPTNIEEEFVTTNIEEGVHNSQYILQASETLFLQSHTSHFYEASETISLAPDVTSG